VLGQRQARKQHRTLQHFLDTRHRANRPAIANKNRIASKRKLDRALSGLRQLAFEHRAKRRRRGFKLNRSRPDFVPSPPPQSAS
jgi:hypothetical protein